MSNGEHSVKIQANAEDIQDVEDELTRNRRMILETRQMIYRGMWGIMGGMGAVLLMLGKMAFG